MPTTTESGTDPRRYQPPLGWWGHIWRMTLTVLLGFSIWALYVPRQWSDHRLLFWTDLALGIVSIVLVAFRRRAPLTIAIIVTLLSGVSVIAAAPSLLATVSLATRRVIWEIVLIGVLGLVAAQTQVVINPEGGSDPYWINLITNVAVIVAVLAWGMYLGSRRELLWTLRDQVARAADEQELRSEKAKVDERARIAREMHDVLAHRISQVSMQAGALAFREDLSADELRRHAAVIQTQANTALDDLRAVLGVLRDRESGALLDKPQPTYADLPDLFHGAREAGMRLTVGERVDGEVPTQTGRTAYRVVQEALTNAHKHARDTTVTIALEGAPDEGLDIVVRNPLGFGASVVPGAGLGLVGLTERAELRGGRLDYRVEGSTFVLRAWLPWAA